MAILWRNNPRAAPRGLIYSITHRAFVTAGPDIQYALYWGEIATGATGQGSQTVDAVGTILNATAGTAQGSQSISATGDIRIDGGPGATGQGSQTVGGLIAQVLDATITTGQSQSVQLYGDAHTPIPYYGGETRLWRANPRGAAYGLIYSFVTGNASSEYDNAALELFFGLLCDSATGQGSQSINAAGNLIADATQGTRQGSQSINAAGDVILVSTGTTGQGSQSIAAAGLVKADATATTAQGSQSIAATSASAPMAAAVATGQGSQSIHVVAARLLASAATTRQAGGSVAAVGIVTPMYVHPTGYSTMVFGTAHVYNKTSYIAGPPSFDSMVFGTATVVGPRIIRAEGYAQDEYGDAAVSNKTHYIQPSGLDDSAFGSPTVREKRQYGYAAGSDSLEVGHAFVGFLPFMWIQQYDSSDSLEFGTPLIHYAGVTPLYVLGFDSSAFGTPVLKPHDIYPHGFDTSAFGTAWVSNHTRYVSPTGFDDFRYGTPWVSLYVRNIYPNGFDHSIVWDQFGPMNPDGTFPGVYHGAFRIYPVGFDNSELDGCFNLHPFIGEPKITGGTPQIRPTGFDSMNFAADYEAADYCDPSYFANDNAIKVSHA